MGTYVIFYGKPSSLIYYCYDCNGKVTELNSLLRDTYFLESELFYEDNRNNKDVFSKYLLEDSKGKKYTLLKLFSKIKQISGTRISEFGVAILSDNDLELCKKNYNLLEDLKITFAEHSVTNGQFNTIDFSNITDAIWKYLHDNELFNAIIINERDHPAFSTRFAVILKTNDDLYDICTIKSNNYQKIYFVTDKDFFEHLISKSDFTHNCYIQEGHNLLQAKYEKINNHYNVNTIRKVELPINTSKKSISGSYKPQKASNRQNSNTRIPKIPKVFDFLKNMSLHYYVHIISTVIIFSLVFLFYNSIVTPNPTIIKKTTIHSFSDTLVIDSILKNKDTLITRKVYDTTFILTIIRNGNNEVVNTERTFSKLDSTETEIKKKFTLQELVANPVHNGTISGTTRTKVKIDEKKNEKEPKENTAPKQNENPAPPPKENTVQPHNENAAPPPSSPP